MYRIILLALFSIFILPGCYSNFTYVSGIMTPKSSVITTTTRGKLSFVNKAVNFTIKQYNMNSTKHYRKYTPYIKKESVLYLLKVTDKFLIPINNKNFIPIISNMNYQKELKNKNAYFQSHIDNLISERDYYKSKGFDVYLRSTTNYNSSNGEGSFITKDFIKRDRIRQVYVIAHEICHEWNEEYIGRNYSANLDESECSFRGRIISCFFFKEKSKTSNYYKKLYLKSLNKLNEDLEEAQFVTHYIDSLNSIYQNNNLTNEVKINLRNDIFHKLNNVTTRTINNARLWDLQPYTKYFELYYNLYKSCKNLNEYLEILKESPADEEQGIQYITAQISARMATITH